MQSDNLHFSLQEFISRQTFSVNEKTWFLSRCIDGRYEGNDLEPLAKPGADIGDLLMLLATNEEYSLLLTREQLIEVFIETIGGWINFRAHTDQHHPYPADMLLGDGYFKEAYTDPDAFSTTRDDILYISEVLKEHVNEYKFTTLEGDHKEKAVVIVEGADYSVRPFDKELHLSVFVYHKTLDNKRRRMLAKAVEKIVSPDLKLDEEYLYEVMSTVADNHFLEIIARLAKTLPVYELTYKSDGQHDLELQ